jgi:hypothetical protein
LRACARTIRRAQKIESLNENLRLATSGF